MLKPIRTNPRGLTPGRSRLAAVFALCSLAACAGAQAQAQTLAYAAPSAERCPPGTYDYGDGMVASVLPRDAETALSLAHTAARNAAGARRSSFLADQPWHPHVSVIYGISDERATPASRALHAYAASHHEASAIFGGLQYWDDDRGNKTTLIVDVIEPAGSLKALHDALAHAANIGSRFAYHPHVTLLYLQAHTRLSSEQEAAVLAPLQGVRWSNETFYLTDPCGQTVDRAQTQAQSQVSSEDG